MCSLVLPSEWEANSLKNASHNQFFARLIKTTALSETKLSYYCVCMAVLGGVPTEYV